MTMLIVVHDFPRDLLRDPQSSSQHIGNIGKNKSIGNLGKLNPEVLRFLEILNIECCVFTVVHDFPKDSQGKEILENPILQQSSSKDLGSLGKYQKVFEHIEDP